MRPHEEEWLLEADDAESAPEIWRKDGGLLFSCNDKERATLAHAAPDMARRMLANMEDGHRKDCPHSLRRYRAVAVPCSEDCEADRAVLTKAGVIP